MNKGMNILYQVHNNLYVNLSIKYVVLHKMVGFFRNFLKIRMMIFILFYVMMQAPAARPAHTASPLYTILIGSAKLELPAQSLS